MSGTGPRRGSGCGTFVSPFANLCTLHAAPLSCPLLPAHITQGPCSELGLAWPQAPLSPAAMWPQAPPPMSMWTHPVLLALLCRVVLPTVLTETRGGHSSSS